MDEKGERLDIERMEEQRGGKKIRHAGERAKKVEVEM